MPSVIIPPTDVSPNTGTGSEVLSNSPTLVTPNIGAATGTSVNLTGAGTFGGNLTVNGTGLSSVAGALNVTGALLAHQTAAINIAHEGSSLSQIVSYGADASTYGKLNVTLRKAGTGVGAVTALALTSTDATLAGNLTVSGAAAIGTATPNANVALNIANTGTDFTIKAVNTSAVSSNGLAITTKGTSASDYALFVRSNDGSNTVLAANNAGNTTLGGNLTVNGTGTSTIGGTGSQISFPANATVGSGGGVTGLTLTQNWRLRRENATTGDFILDESGVDKLRITSAGNATLAGNLTVSGTGTSSFASTTGFSFSQPVTAGFETGARGTGAGVLFNTPSLSAAYNSGLGVDGTYSAGKSVINISACGVYSGGPYSADLAFKTSSGTTLTEQMRLTSGGNLLLGTTTDSSNGKLQLATHTTSAGGIGFGTDYSLYRQDAANILINASTVSGSNTLWLSVAGSLLGSIGVNSGGCFVGSRSAGMSTYISSGSGTTALTLDSSQNATFAGKIIVNGTGIGMAGQTNPAVQGISTSGNSINVTANSSGNVNLGTAANSSLVSISSSGDITMTSGTALQLGSAYTAGAPSATGYVTIKASNGTTYKVLVST